MQMCVEVILLQILKSILRTIENIFIGNNLPANRSTWQPYEALAKNRLPTQGVRKKYQFSWH